MSFLNLVYPNICFGCKKNLYTKNYKICYTCWKKLAIVRKPICRYCGRYSQQETCLLCENQKYFFNELRFVGKYEDLLKRFILEFKFSGKTYLTYLFAEVMWRQIKKMPFPEKIDIVVPVPLHFWRLWHRGYNQSALLAFYLAKKIGCEYNENNLHKIKNTIAQSLLPKEQRRMNVQNAFAVDSGDVFHHKNILLVDDVYTSGNTIQECSRILKEQTTVKNIYVCVIARS